ncbi:hypothetical protein Barb4_00110 [Bacteroidales bacterium Barb4]|nr:hypothetical protein Barb4_00110 [Bacteroidales bacterium Barb4]
MKDKEGIITEKNVAKKSKKTVSARDRIKPRGASGFMKGKIHYDEDADIFNLEI